MKNLFQIKYILNKQNYYWLDKWSMNFKLLDLIKNKKCKIDKSKWQKIWSVIINDKSIIWFK